MRLRSSRSFPTLVDRVVSAARGPAAKIPAALAAVALSWASPAPAAPEPNVSGEEFLDSPNVEFAPESARPRPDVEGTLAPAPAPAPAPRPVARPVSAPAESDEFWRPRPHALIARAGAGFDPKRAGDGAGPMALVGFDYAFEWADGRSYEAGLDALSGGRGALRFGRKLRWGRGRARPFAKIGAGIELDPDAAQASFVTYKNWQARASIGASFATSETFSLRAEAEASASVADQRAFAILGASWEW